MHKYILKTTFGCKKLTCCIELPLKVLSRCKFAKSE
uniref:Uncharacterized protein n=1 Tax=Anguilla anguilla TaxID=7936 RepID=A0A0E9XDP1_ANGAN